MRSKNRLWLTLIGLAVSSILSAQSVVGKWKTIDDRSGMEKSILNVYLKGEKLYAEVVQILEKGKENAVCINCKGPLKDKPIIGMKIFNGLEKIGNNEYGKGSVFDPENGDSYRCKVWLNEKDPNELMVRGYVAFFFRTQTWIRIAD